MNQETVPTWMMWDAVSAPPLQPSRLYHLEPIGLGTPFVESLSSYILRLAEAHNVLPRHLAYYVRDNATEKAHFPSLSFQNAYALSSNSGLAQRWVSALERLTLRQDLASLTMLPWAQLFATTGLMHKHLAWCPDCWRGWREAGVPLSIPLLWLVSAVSICPHHQKPLQWYCPGCGHRQPIMAGTGYLGYCAHCHGLLDAASSIEKANNPPLDSNARGCDLWIAQSLGALLAATPELIRVAADADISQFAEQCIKQLGQGNLTNAARLLGLSPPTLSYWRRRNSRVNAISFFTACFQCGSPPLEVIVHGRFTVQAGRAGSGNEPEPPRPKRYGRRRHLDKEKLALKLEAIIAHSEQQPLNMREVIARLGCSRETLTRHFPEQYRILQDRYWGHMAAQLKAKREKIAQALAEALQEWPPPTTAEVAERIGYSTGSLFKHFHAQFQAISTRSHDYKEAQVRQEIERLRQALEGELASDEWPPPPTREVLARLHRPPKFVYKHCPEQCRALSARHLAYRRSQGEERMRARQAEVRRVLQEIHDEGLYPSRYLLSKRLSKPSMMLGADVREAYRQMLRDLGYEDG
jgi:AcrR family transcriptional regulator